MARAIEYRELYDENRRPLGRTIAAGEKVPKGAFVVAVGMWIVNSRHEILLTQRSPEKRFAPGKWENTSGHLQAGETCEQAIIRELREETGIEAAPEDIRYLGTAKAAPYFGDNYCVYKDVELDLLRFQPGETCGAKWVTLEELERMMRDGETSPSMGSHMESYREALYRAVRGNE